MFSGNSLTDILIILVSIIISLSIHEAMHGFMAHWLGDSTAEDMGRLTLNPLKHVDVITTVLLPIVLIVTIGQPFFAAKPVPFNPDRVRFGDYGAALVGIAGPLTNLVLAILAALVLHATQPVPGSLFANVLTIFTEVNIGFLVFNMIPFPPLDGSRLLYAFAPEGLREIMRQIEAAGFMAILVFMLVIFRFVSGPIINIENSILRFLL